MRVIPPNIEAAKRHERSGRWEDAYREYEEAYRVSFRARDVRSMVGAFIGLSRVNRMTHRVEAAAEMADLAVGIARAHGLTMEAARAINMLAALRHEREEWGAAEALYFEALDLARDEGDDELIGAISQNLGAIANAQGRLREARALYLEAIGASVRCGNVHLAAMTYNNLGMACTDLEEWTEAEINFLRGAEIAERLGDLGLTGRLLTHRAEPLIRKGEFGAAADSLARAREVAERLNDPPALIDIHRYLGMMARLQGAYEEADRQLERALDIVRETGIELSRGEVSEEVARLRHAQGRSGAAGAMLREARRAYDRTGALSDIARVDRLRAAWDAAAAGQPTA